MSGKQVQRRRGTSVDHTAWVGAFAEVTVDVTKMVEVVHDGTTPGGFPQASARDIATVTGLANTAQTTANTALANAATAQTAANNAQTAANAAQTKANQAQSEVDALETVVATNDQQTVKKDSDTGAARISAGTSAQRPVAPVEGDFRFNKQLVRWEGYTVAGGWGQVGGDSLPLFFTHWFPNRAAIAAGFVVLDGQVLNRATYPDAAAGIVAGNVPVATDANWLSSPTLRGYYTTGDGASTFRLPDYNGKAAGSLGAVFTRGDGANSAGSNGVIRDSQNRVHTHTLTDPGHFHAVTDPGHGHVVNDPTHTHNFLHNIGTAGASFQNDIINTAVAGNSGQVSWGSSVIGAATGIAINAHTSDVSIVSKVTGATIANDGGTDSHPIEVTGCWAVKLFGSIINPGAADAAQLASDLANLTAVVQNQCYKKNNILGAVGLAAGVPTGAIIEQGTNANGSYIKLANGTLFASINGVQATFSNSSNIGIVWNYPVAPTALTFVGSNLIGTLGIGKNINTVSAFSRNGTLASISALSQANFVAGDAAGVQFDAFLMGRWD